VASHPLSGSTEVAVQNVQTRPYPELQVGPDSETLNSWLNIESIETTISKTIYAVR
jgi:hypothetical protein